MRRAVAACTVIFLLGLSIFITGCIGDDTGDKQRDESVDFRWQAHERAREKYGMPNVQNFPLYQLLKEYTEKADLLNHPWYTYIYSDDGRVTHYFVSTTVPVNSCAFLGSTEDVETKHEGTIVLTAPSLDGIFYGGAGAASACNGWIFKDAATGALGLIFGTKIQSYEAPLILETEPVLIRVCRPNSPELECQ